MDNFRVSDDGKSVEVDITLTITSETVMNEFARVQRNLQNIEGVTYTHVDDLPLAVVRKITEDWLGNV